MSKTLAPFCLRWHPRSTYGYRDKHGRSRCKKCDELAKKGPLTNMKRRPRSFQNTWRWLASQPVDILAKLLTNLELKNILDKQQVTVLRLRFGVDRGGSMRTEDEVGAIMKLTRPRINMIENDAYYQITDEAARRRAERAVKNSTWEFLP